VGAVPGRGILRLAATAGPVATAGSPLFDVEPLRRVTTRLARARAVATPTLVLGSTQPEQTVRRDALARQGVAAARRRGGGGAVYLAPGAQLWVDVWLPRRDPLWVDDVVAAAEWVGAWWAEALRRAGVVGLEVHAGRASAETLEGLVCFAGRGPGEVFHRGRKVVGLSQWRAREGALFSSCAYRHWDPAPLAELLEVADDPGQRLDELLRPVAVGLADLEPPVTDLASVEARLLGSLADFALP